MRSKKSLIIIILLLLSLSSCFRGQKSGTTHLRLLSMIPGTHGTIEIQGKGVHQDIHKTLDLSFAEKVDYQSLPAGYYNLSFSVQGKKLLQGEYALGKNGYYTMLITGLQPKQWSVNPQSITYKLKHWVAGSELADPNKNMPQWFMMRDNIEVTGSRAHLRIVNANPYLSKISVYSSTGTLGTGLWYPKINEIQKVTPGRHKLQVRYGNIETGEKTFTFEAGFIYTLVVGPGQPTTGDITLRLLDKSAEQ